MLPSAQAGQTLIDQIDRALPQTQCTRCGYADCRSYARAIVVERAAANRCPPGGEAGARRLAHRTGRDYLALDPACGEERPRRTAVIDEARCIGCTLCIQACPIDAIIGAPQWMHTVIADLCSGCELCVAPCPVDCIAMVPGSGAAAIWDEQHAARARERYERQCARRAQAVAGSDVSAGAYDHLAAAAMPEAKRAAIAAALERARARRRAP